MPPLMLAFAPTDSMLRFDPIQGAESHHASVDARFLAVAARRDRAVPRRDIPIIWWSTGRSNSSLIFALPAAPQ